MEPTVRARTVKRYVYDDILEVLLDEITKDDSHADASNTLTVAQQGLKQNGEASEGSSERRGS